jgi:phage shock protein A
MSVLRRLIDAVRGGARDVAELISSGTGISSLEQDLMQVQSSLYQVKQELTEVMSKQMHSSRQVVTLKMQIAELETEANHALDQGDESTAMAIAENIAQIDTDLEDEELTQKVFVGHVARLKSLVHKTERQISEYERQLTMIKTAESIQKASDAISQNYSSSSKKIHSARDTLEQIKKRQQRALDMMDAEQEVAATMGEKTLEQELEMAGITDAKINASAVLDRIKSRRK